MPPNPNPKYENRLVLRGDTCQDRNDENNNMIANMFVAKIICLTIPVNRIFLFVACIK